MFTSNAREGLAIAEIVFYVPALSIAALVTLRHGFNRHDGWIFLVILSFGRVIGYSCGLAAQLQSNPSSSLIEAAVILSSVGLSPLILAMLGILSRVHSGMTNGRGLPPRVFRLLFIPSTVALILAIVGGSDQFSSKLSDQSQGRTLTRAAIILFVVTFVVQSGIALLSFFNFRAISQGETRLLIAVACSIPFLAVRLIYSVLSVFVTDSTTFSLTEGSVVVEGFMAVFEEFMVVILYLSAGLATPKLVKKGTRSGRYMEAGDVSLMNQAPGIQHQHVSKSQQV